MTRHQPSPDDPCDGPQGTKDQPTVTPDGKRLVDGIEGVKWRPAPTQVDGRGSLRELYDPRWGFDDGPLVYVYQSTLRAGAIKGWVYHRLQDDRLAPTHGEIQIVLYDRRPESPTHGRVCEYFVNDTCRGLLLIPAEVAHAVRNIGATEACFVNLPTRPYQHQDPDKYRIALNSPDIPYRFPEKPGWQQTHHALDSGSENER